MSSSLLKQGSQKRSTVIYVPRRIANVIPDGAKFDAELTAEGILFRFVGFTDSNPPPLDVPAWAVKS
jgi:hypothetical protein